MEKAILREDLRDKLETVKTEILYLRFFAPTEGQLDTIKEELKEAID